MSGPSEFHSIGPLKDWDITDRLGEIGMPTLVITGEFDEATPAINRTVSGGIPGAESVIHPGGSHMAHVEDPAGYKAVLDDFLTRVETGAWKPAEQAGGPIPGSRQHTLNADPRKADRAAMAAAQRKEIISRPSE